MIDMRWHGDFDLHGLLCAANLGMFCCCILTGMRNLLCKAAVPWPSTQCNSLLHAGWCFKA